MLTLTPQAQAKIKGFFEAEACAKGKCLRVMLKPSGCAGYEYAFSFDEKRDGDTVLPQAGFDVVIDPQAMPLLETAVIDYRDDPMNSGFKISNPREKSSCGCGKSKQF